MSVLFPCASMCLLGYHQHDFCGCPVLEPPGSHLQVTEQTPEWRHGDGTARRGSQICTENRRSGI